MIKSLYAPWRNKYLKSKEKECPFCAIANDKPNKKDKVFYKDDICFCTMNKYPYAPAHLLVVPNNHIDCLTLLEQKEYRHIMDMARRCILILKEYGAQGVNMGVNIHKSAGAGIPEHVHIHILPRYIGDTNFITTIGNSRVYGFDFDEIYDKIKHIAQKVLV